MEDIGQIIYWLAAVRADIEFITNSGGLDPHRYAKAALENLTKADASVERVATGVNRGRTRSKVSTAAELRQAAASDTSCVGAFARARP